MRVLFAWLLMLAVPVQGIAAASMVFCGMSENHSHAAQVLISQANAAPLHDVRGAAHHHDHSAHGHLAGGQATQVADHLPDSAHKCSVCADCCNSVAIVNLARVAAVAPAPQSQSAEPFVLIHARPSSVPDKPPRA